MRSAGIESEKPLPVYHHDSPEIPVGQFVILFDRTVDKIPELVKNWRQHGMRYEWQALGQFRKDWYEMPHKRVAMLEKPLTGRSDDPHLAYIAAMIHMLCLDTNHPVPNWVHKFVSKQLMMTLQPTEKWETLFREDPAALDKFHPVGKLHNVVLEHPSHFLRQDTTLTKAVT